MSHSVDRRDFLKAAAATGLTFVASSAVRGAEANSRIELGLIGYGGRGSWIADLFNENGKAKIVAVHDYFQDRVDAAGEKLGIETSRRFTGLDGYHQLLQEKLDGIVIISPPYFHPQQAIAAMEHGKHVYLAKPIAVDVPSAMSLVEAARKVKGKLCTWVDFQTRVDEFYQGAAKKLREGAIGDPIMAQAYYHTGRLGIHVTPGTETARLRNWVFDKNLSGDIIVEQNIHALDVANWFLGAHPIKATGTGGRRVRTDVGDCWDHFLCLFDYPNDVQVTFQSKQFGHGADDICVRVFCPEGSVESHYGGQVSVRGKSGSLGGGNTGDLYRNGAINNIKLYLDAIAAGKPIDNMHESARSTMTAVLGRMASYNQTTVTWDEMLRANEKLDPKLNLPKDGPQAKA